MRESYSRLKAISLDARKHPWAEWWINQAKNNWIALRNKHIREKRS